MAEISGVLKRGTSPRNGMTSAVEIGDTRLFSLAWLSIILEALGDEHDCDKLRAMHGSCGGFPAEFDAMEKHYGKTVTIKV